MQAQTTQNGSAVNTEIQVKLEEAVGNESQKFDGTIKQRTKNILDALNVGVFDKEDAIRLSLLSINK